MKKIVYLGVIFIMMFTLISCGGEKFATDSVVVKVKAEFRQKFGAEEFTVEDFAWNNVKEIGYEFWYENDLEYKGSIKVYLKKHGEKQVLAAIEHFKTLDFVEYAQVIGYGVAFNK